MSAKRVAVIGAGAAGLVTARELIRVGLEPTIFDRQAGVGGIWRYDARTEPDPLGLDVGEARLHGSLYASLRTNLPTDLMAFRDFPFDARGGGEDDWPRFCGHREVLTYLERFAAHFDLRPHLRLEQVVTRLVPLYDGADGAPDGEGPHRGGPDAWRLVSTDPSGRVHDDRYDAVAICNGHYSRPRVPELLGRFTGARSHSHNYRRPDGFAGQRVVILGARSSGTDLSREIARVAERVHLCARDHDHHRPLAPFENLFAEPAIARLGPARDIQLADGRIIERVDHLLYCTGYRYAFPFLEGPFFDADLVRVEDDWVGPLFLDLVPPEAMSLAFLGLPFAVVPFPLVEAQARWWAGVLAGALPRPSAEAMAEQAHRAATALDARGVARRHRLRYGERHIAYVDDLARRAGAAPLPAWFAPLYRATREAKAADPEGYRDGPLARRDARRA